jgi:peptide deformylase
VSIKVAKVLAYPDDHLRQTSRPVPVDDVPTMDLVRTLAMTLRETMYDAKGWGLSAIQIGVPIGVFVVHIPHEFEAPLVFVNPFVVRTSSDRVTLNEGCLSFKGVREPIERPERVTMRRWNERGQFCEDTEYRGWTARAIQHEMEHLSGRLLIDHLLPAARRMLDRSIRRKDLKRAAKAAK